MTTTRRALFVANDGLGAGHVVRALAVGRALAAWMAKRGLPFSWMLATTSEADALIRAAGALALRLPSPGAARGQGLPLSAYRRLQQETLRGLFDGFSPDLLVVDTFPAGPHLELASLVEQAPLRALIQRAVLVDTRNSPEMTTARGHYHVTLAPADPLPLASPWRGVTQVPPIVLDWPKIPRNEARAALGLGPSDRAALVNPGGGGDPEALATAEALAAALERRGYRATLAAGPLAHGHPSAGHLCPLAPHLLAFDLAVAAAGYNSAHELAAAGVRTLLFARPRAFDDQAGRARRFAQAGLAVALDGTDDEALDRALAVAQAGPAPGLAVGGADAAAAVLGALLLGER